MRAPITDKHLLEMMWERFPEIMKRGAEQPAQTDWEAVAADQAMTIALLKAELQEFSEKQADSVEVALTESGWVGLTDEEIISMSRYDLEYAALIGEVQRKLKEKNT